MKKGLAILIALTFAIPASAQSAAELDAMEARIMAKLEASILAKIEARHDSERMAQRAHIKNIEDDVRQIRQGQDALVKALGGKMKSTPTWDGSTTTFNMQSSSSSTMMQSGYGSSMTATAPRTPVRTVIRRAFRGHGSGGSASSGSGSG